MLDLFIGQVSSPFLKGIYNAEIRVVNGRYLSPAPLLSSPGELRRGAPRPKFISGNDSSSN